MYCDYCGEHISVRPSVELQDGEVIHIDCLDGLRAWYYVARDKEVYIEPVMQEYIEDNIWNLYRVQ